MALGAVQFGQGLASGINFRAIVDAIVNAERQPIVQIQKRNDTFTRARNSFEELGKLLDGFSGSLAELKSGGRFGGKLAKLDSADAPLTASATSAATAGAYDIQVQQLAQAHRVRSATMTDKFSPLVSDGTITIKAGSSDTITVNVSAADGNNSLQAIADMINGADKGVSATIVNDGSGDILLLKSQKSGTANALQITDSTNLGLDETGHTLQAAQNARLTVDGLTISSQDNQVSEAIAGVTLNLTGETTSPVTLTVAEDTESTKAAIKAFVDSYNKINDFFQKNFGSATEQRASAIASGGTARGVQRTVQGLLTGSVEGIAAGNLSSLSELGIVIADNTGRVEFDSRRFDDLVEQGRYDQIRSVLLSSGSTSDVAVRYQGAASSTKAGTYALTVSRAAERAEVLGSAPIGTGGLAQNENLTISIDGASTTVALASGDAIDAIVTKLNRALDAAGVRASAYSAAGVLAFRSDDYGALQTLSVVSDVADAGNGSSTGIGTTAKTDNGVDIAGTIGGVAAIGAGNELIGADGTPADGLRVAVYATAASIAAKGGNFGTVGFSQGVADRFIEAIDKITNPLDGTIKSVRDAFNDSIELGKARIDTIQTRLDRRQELLIKQFSFAESAISQLQSYQSSLSGLR